MKKILSYIVGIVILFQYSCSDQSLEELSVDPNNPVNASPTLLLTAAQVNVLSEFGFDWDRYSGAFVQTFAGNHAGGINADRYELTTRDYEGAFNRLYRGGLKDCYEIINTQGPANNAWHHVGVAKVLMATGLGYLTDVYGDIPYTEAFIVNEFLNPKYNTQEEIYNTIFALLEEAIVDLNKTPQLALAGDLVHENDTSKWIATANLLLARYHNHLSKRDPAGSAALVLQYVDAAKVAGLTSNDWNYALPYDKDDPNWYNNWYTLFENNLIIASENFMEVLLSPGYGSWDPRLFSYWNTKSIDGTFVDFSGKQNGLPTGPESYSPVGNQGYYGKEGSPQLIATHFELLFIEAEAALRASNIPRAVTAYNEALSSQINLVALAGVEHAMDYFDIDNAAATTAISSRVTAYINANTVTAANITLEKVMTEKYKAMFTMNAETWVDLRRHDFSFPDYLALPQETKLSEFIRRALYPQSEITNNSSTPTGVTMTDRLWWDQ